MSRDVLVAFLADGAKNLVIGVLLLLIGRRLSRKRPPRD